MNTIYFGGCWSTNIGNAFIDLGSLYTLAKYNPLLYSELSKFYFTNYDHYYETYPAYKPKYAIFSGMVHCQDFINDHGKLCDKLTNNNIPIILNGTGAARYDHKEKQAFRTFLKNHNIQGFLSRDDQTYDDYHDILPNSYRGIDCGFFLPEAFPIVTPTMKQFEVFNLECSLAGFPPEVHGYDGNNPDHIVCHHQTLDGRLNRYFPEEHTGRARTMIAELPFEYVYLYAQSRRTVSNRVHACVATLAFGGAARLVQRTGRASLFDRVGCGGLREGFVTADAAVLAERKREHLSALDEVMRVIATTV